MNPQEQLLNAINEAHAAGDTESARVLTHELRKMLQPVTQIPTEGAPQAPASVATKQRGFVETFLRGAGVSGRGLMKGIGGFADLIHEPLRKLAVNPALEAAGLPTADMSVRDMASVGADKLGLATPDTGAERMAEGTAELGASAATGAGLARLAAPALQGAPRAVAEILAANPGTQVASGATSGLASSAAREEGLGPTEQLAAGVAGAVAAPFAVQGVSKAAGALEGLGKTLVSALQDTPAQNMEQKLTVTLRAAGVDWARIPEKVKQSLRSDIAKALSTNSELDPAALRRLVDYRKVGATPTRGTLTLDPVAVTHERNLAKTGANSIDPSLHALANIADDNKGVLVKNLDDLGAARALDAYGTGERVLGALKSKASAADARIAARYKLARDSQGRSLPLDPGAFSRRANELLDEANVGSFLTSDIAKKMNAMAKGEIPLTVEIAEQLKTSIGNIARATNNGNERKALQLVRQALDDAPLLPSQTVNPGNLPVDPKNVPAGAQQVGEAAIKNFNRARKSFAAQKRVVEKTPALAAAIENFPPDQFVQKFIVGQGATTREVQALKQALKGDPDATEAVRSHIVLHLRQKALNSAESEVGHFSPSGYNRALEQIGTRKLKEFFTEAEIDQLKAIGRVSAYEKYQPTGSAVNNSNSGALLLGKGADMAQSVLGKLPFGLDATLSGLLQHSGQNAARNVPKALGAPGGRKLSPLEQLTDTAGRGNYYGVVLPPQRRGEEE